MWAGFARPHKNQNCHIDRMGDISKEVGDEIPHTSFGMTHE